MTQPTTTPASARPDPAAEADAERARRRRDGAGATPTSTLPEAQITGEPGEEVLGGADGVPLTPDETIQSDASKTR